MLPHRYTGITPGMRLLRESPFAPLVVFLKACRTFPFLFLENSSSKNHQQMEYALALEKLNCNGCCALCNLLQRIKSSPTLRPLSSNRQSDRVYRQVQLLTRG